MVGLAWHLALGTRVSAFDVIDECVVGGGGVCAQCDALV
jgi:hypothetical protein